MARRTRSYSDITGAEAERYVRTHKDLLDTWRRMDEAQFEGTDSAELKYWTQKMGKDFSIQAFGEAHRGHDQLLFQGRINEGGIHRYAQDGSPTDKWNQYFKDGKMRALTGNYSEPKPPEPVRDLIGEGFDVEVPDSPQQEAEDIRVQIAEQTKTLESKITELQTELKTMTESIDRQSLGIPPDAPAHIKTYEQYREWLMRQNAAVGYGSTVTTSMSGVEDMTEGVSKPLLTAVYPTSS